MFHFLSSFLIDWHCPLLTNMQPGPGFDNDQDNVAQADDGVVDVEDDDDDPVVWWRGVGNLQHFSRGRRGPEADIRGAAFFYRNTWHGNSWTWSYGNDTKRQTIVNETQIYKCRKRCPGALQRDPKSLLHS